MDREIKKIHRICNRNTPIIKLFGAREDNVPIEYVIYHYHEYGRHCHLTRVNSGGTCRLAGIYDRGFYFKDYNLPFAILVSGII